MLAIDANNKGAQVNTKVSKASKCILNKQKQYQYIYYFTNSI